MTPEQVMALNPCDRYNIDILNELWAGRESLTVQELLALPISMADRIWVVENGCLTAEQKNQVKNLLSDLIEDKESENYQTFLTDPLTLFSALVFAQCEQNGLSATMNEQKVIERTFDAIVSVVNQ